MAIAYNFIASITVTSAVASVTFSSIAGTYTDLVVKCSTRSDRASVASPTRLYPNASSTSITLKALVGSGAAASSQDQTAFSAFIGETSASTATASTFGSFEIYIPNYTSSNNKSVSIDSVSETNATTVYAVLTAFLWPSSAAITSLQILDGLGNFVQYSTFYLYGINKL